MSPGPPCVLVVGAGPAGLATSYELQRRGIEHRVLERGEQAAHSWRNLYDSLTLHTGKHMSALPGMPFPASTPLFPSRQDFLGYLERYAAAFRLPVETGCEVTGAVRLVDGWRVRTRRGERRARALVMATGIIANPHLPDLPGRARFRGRTIHSVDYRRPDSFVRRRVLVVGVGNSGGEIATELARGGAEVTIAVRSGAIALPRQLLGIPIQYFSRLMSWLPRPAQRVLVAATGKLSVLWRGRPPLARGDLTNCPDVPLIGFHLFDAIQEGLIRVKGGVAGFTEDGVRFGDGSAEPFQDVILATGFRAAVDMLGAVISLDECGFARRVKRVCSLDQPDLYFVGHNYDARGGLFNIVQDCRLVAREIARRA